MDANHSSINNRPVRHIEGHFFLEISAAVFGNVASLSPRISNELPPPPTKPLPPPSSFGHALEWLLEPIDQFSWFFFSSKTCSVQRFTKKNGVEMFFSSLRNRCPTTSVVSARATSLDCKQHHCLIISISLFVL